MAVKLHRCPVMFAKFGAHPCWKVQMALEEEGISYAVVKGPLLKARREDIERLSGQRAYPVIELADGRVYRAESAEMVDRIRAGRLEEPRATGPS